VRSADKSGSEQLVMQLGAGALICPPRVQADHAWCGAGVGGFTEAAHALDTGESVLGWG